MPNDNRKESQPDMWNAGEPGGLSRAVPSAQCSSRVRARTLRTRTKLETELGRKRPETFIVIWPCRGIQCVMLLCFVKVSVHHRLENCFQNTCLHRLLRDADLNQHCLLNQDCFCSILGKMACLLSIRIFSDGELPVLQGSPLVGSSNC